MTAWAPDTDASVPLRVPGHGTADTVPADQMSSQDPDGALAPAQHSLYHHFRIQPLLYFGFKQFGRKFWNLQPRQEFISTTYSPDFGPYHPDYFFFGIQQHNLWPPLLSRTSLSRTSHASVTTLLTCDEQMVSLGPGVVSDWSLFVRSAAISAYSRPCSPSHGFWHPSIRLKIRRVLCRRVKGVAQPTQHPDHLLALCRPRGWRATATNPLLHSHCQQQRAERRPEWRATYVPIMDVSFPWPLKFVLNFL